MKINFTKREYQALFEMLFVADWVIHGYEVELRGERRPGFADLVGNDSGLY